MGGPIGVHAFISGVFLNIDIFQINMLPPRPGMGCPCAECLGLSEYAVQSDFILSLTQAEIGLLGPDKAYPGQEWPISDLSVPSQVVHEPFQPLKELIQD